MGKEFVKGLGFQGYYALPVLAVRLITRTLPKALAILRYKRNH